MLRIALTMLAGDRTKFLGIVFGLAFATLLMTQQSGIFRGVMVLSYGHVTDTPQAEVWIGDPGMPDFDTNSMINERELDNVRSVNGVRWVTPLFRRIAQCRLPNDEISPLMLMGIDDATRIGAPLPEAMVAGSVEALERPDTIIIDEHGAGTKLRVELPGGGSRPMRIGDHMLINWRTIEVVGICRSTLSLMLYPTGYMMRSQASMLDLGSDRPFNFLIAGLAPEADPEDVCRRIGEASGLVARTRKSFSEHVYDFFFYKTGIPANFGIAVLLGFIVGAAIAGQMFNQLVNEIFASLKAMGMRNSGLSRILLAQAVASALIGYGLGAGTTVLFGRMLDGTDLSFRLEPGILAVSFAAVLAISVSAALLSLRSLVRLDPALVFRS